MKKFFFLILLIGIGCSWILWFPEKIQDVFQPASLPCQVVIDIGHGGKDPGKVAVNGALEKDINLAIGLFLYEYLDAAGYLVRVTRDKDTSLANPEANNQKMSDLQNRTDFIGSMAPSAVISIHQNSYSDKAVYGAQVFHSGEEYSKVLASFIQDQFRRILGPDQSRSIKEQRDYYLFRNITSPTIIVECGFLSNYREANLLIKESYQQKIAWAIYMGTVQFLKTIE